MIDSPQGRKKKTAGGYAPYIDLGLRFAAAVLIGTYAGYWLDSRLSTLPVFMILGMLLGVTSGFLSIYRAAYPPPKSEKDDD